MRHVWNLARYKRQVERDVSKIIIVYRKTVAQQASVLVGLPSSSDQSYS